MLEHLNQVSSLPPRTVVLGATGFVGGALLKRLAERGATTLALTRSDVDLMADDAGERIASLLRPDDAFVAVAAKAPCKNVQMLAENVKMTLAMVEALRLAPVAHVINVSSDAVYADGPLPITEETPRAPTSLHGVMHLAREIAFMAEVNSPLAIVRPSLLYGIADPHNGYGPNQFRSLAEDGQDIVLFGNGEERRDHVAIDDVAELITRILERRSVGSLNIATGEVTSFKDIAEIVVSLAPKKVAIKSRPRSGPMPHDGYRPFDATSSRQAFPDFRYGLLRDGIANMLSATPR
jgi:nucleoside-diphosphate-sugar epimerase